MFNRPLCISRRSWLLAFLCVIPVAAYAGYKARPWKPGAMESYPAQMSSQGVTIAVLPLHADKLAEQVFDKKDMVTRGVMPVAVIVSNGNDFPVRIEGETIQLVSGDGQFDTLSPCEAVALVFKGDKAVYIGGPLPPIAVRKPAKPDALEDFEHKFLGTRVVPPKTIVAGFLYYRVRGSDAAKDARIYIPRLLRMDGNSPLLFFEIDLLPALSPPPPR